MADIDHANRDMSDNRFANIREARRSENNANMRRPKDNTSGFKGVSWAKKNCKWRAQIRVDYVTIYLGLFDNPEEAHTAYYDAAQFHFGKFARAT
jgi:hypothetical protein